MIAELGESRRLTGPNLVADVPGAVIDCALAPSRADEFVAAWRVRAREILDAVGWQDEATAERVYAGGATLFLSAPIDALYAATEVNEWAWAAAAADVGADRGGRGAGGPEDVRVASAQRQEDGDAAASGGPEDLDVAVGPWPEDVDVAAARLRALIEQESNPVLLALRAAAAERGLSFLSDDEHASVGTGRGSRLWAVDELPHPREVPWDEVHDVPRVLVTGTNGKTTTVRMLASIVEAEGHTVGFTCTDGIYIGGELLDAGDWSGPGGARAVLRDPRVDFAILESARGGMLRRGLAVDRADAALVTNVAADHLGEWGVLTVDDVATAKLIVAKAVRHGAPLIVNADDPHLSKIAQALDRPLTWIAVESSGHVEADLRASGDGDVVRRGGAAGRDRDLAWVLEAGWLTRISGSSSEKLIEVDAVPATLGGVARYNVSNALSAAALADASGLSDEAIRTGLQGFDPSPEQNPGRGNLFEVAGARVLVDFVHNPHGFDAIAQAIHGMAPLRVGLMIGHAGDRDDESIRDLVRAAWRLAPARVAIKEMSEYLRGRKPGEIPAIIRAEFVALGADEGAMTLHASEVEASAALLEWSKEGDVVLLSSQADRDGVLQLVERERRRAPDAP